jgi:hypothetical protein
MCAMFCWRQRERKLDVFFFAKKSQDNCRGEVKGTLAVFAGAKNPTGQTVSLKKVFLHKLDSLFFHALCPAGLSAFCLAVVVCPPFSSFPLVVRRPISHAVVVRRLRHPPPLSSDDVVICCCRRCLPPPSMSTAAITAAAAVIATPCLGRLLPPALIHPLCSSLLNLICRCCLLLPLSTFVVVVRCRRLPPPQSSSPLRCLCCLSPPTFLLPHRSPPPNHASRHRPPLSLSATVVVRRCRTSTRPPSNKMLEAIQREIEEQMELGEAGQLEEDQWMM